MTAIEWLSLHAMQKLILAECNALLGQAFTSRVLGLAQCSMSDYCEWKLMSRDTSNSFHNKLWKDYSRTFHSCRLDDGSHTTYYSIWSTCTYSSIFLLLFELIIDCTSLAWVILWPLYSRFPWTSINRKTSTVIGLPQSFIAFI